MTRDFRRVFIFRSRSLMLSTNQVGLDCGQIPRGCPARSALGYAVGPILWYKIACQGILRQVLALAILVSFMPAAVGEELLPDLIVWESKSMGFMHGWRLDSQEIPGRTLLRFTSAIPNVGSGPLEVRTQVRQDGRQDVFQTVLATDGSSSNRLIGTFDITPSPHGYLNLEGIAQYSLRQVLPDGAVGEIVASQIKTSRCLTDSEAFDVSLPGSFSLPYYASCLAAPLGVSVGRADVYTDKFKGQWIDVTEVPSGQYWFEVAADPFNRILEQDDSNNVGRILIDLSVPEPSTFVMFLLGLSLLGMWLRG